MKSLTLLESILKTAILDGKMTRCEGAAILAAVLYAQKYGSDHFAVKYGTEAVKTINSLLTGEDK